LFAALQCLVRVVTRDCLQEIQEKILKREVDILLHLSHDNIVRFMNFGYGVICVFSLPHPLMEEITISSSVTKFAILKGSTKSCALVVQNGKLKT